MFTVKAIPFGEIFHASCLMSAFKEWAKQRENELLFNFVKEDKKRSLTLACSTPLDTKTDLSNTQNFPPSMRDTVPPASSTICLKREKKTLILKYIEQTLTASKIVSMFNKYNLKEPVYVSWGMPRMVAVILAS